MLNYRELLITLTASKVDRRQLNNELQVNFNSSTLNSKGLIVGEHEMEAQTVSTCRVGEVYSFDVSDKLLELIEKPKNFKPAEDHLRLSISYKSALDGPFLDAPGAQPAPKVQP
jgi:hypothetical protein